MEGKFNRVFPPDGRVQVTGPELGQIPYNMIGELEITFPNGDNHTGTGTLYQNQYVLTAAHNLYSAELGGRANNIKFTLPDGQETYATNIFYPDEYRRISPLRPEDNVVDYTRHLYDFGLIKLNKYLDLDPSIELCTSNPPMGNIIIAGYPDDKPANSMWRANGPIDSVNDFLFYKISTCTGQSGAALLAPAYNGFYAYGIHICGSSRLNSNFAVHITERVMEQIDSWMQM